MTSTAVPHTETAGGTTTRPAFVLRDDASDLEAAFVTRWRQLGGPDPEAAEHRFAPPRRWRFDFAWPSVSVAVECEGGVWSRGRHVRGAGFEADCEKYNAATARGWSVFRVTAKMLDRDTAGCLEPIIEAVAA